MSSENLKLVQAFYEAWNTGDLEALRESYDANVVMRLAERWPEPGPFVGREAVLRWIEQLRETWDAQTLEPTDVIDAGDRVVVRQVWHGVGRGPDTNIEFTSISTLRDGKTVLVEFFWDHAEALETIGL